MRIRLRQIVVVAADLAATEARIIDELGVDLCHRDPGVGVFGVHNALFAVGDQFLEVISPTQDGTTAGRQLDKRGGDTGYMVMVDVDDLDAARSRIADAGVRVVYEAVDDGIVGLHVHPADIGGAILSIDRPETPGEWPWAGPAWRDHVRDGVVTGVAAAVIEAHDPAAMASRWAAVLDRAVEGDPPTIRLDDGELRFVPAGDRGEGVAGYELRAAPGADPVDVVIAGTRFTSG